MSIHNGEIHVANVDTCKNYAPNESQQTTVVSMVSGVVYECINKDLESDAPFSSCWYCKNMDKKEKYNKKTMKKS